MSAGPEAVTSAALRAYLEAAGWEERQPQGMLGTVWATVGCLAVVPADGDPDLLRVAVDAVAAAEGRTADETAAAVLAYRDASRRAKECGCGPLEPCGEHLQALDDGECDRLAALIRERVAEAAAEPPDVTSPAPVPAGAATAITGAAGRVPDEAVDAALAADAAWVQANPSGPTWTRPPREQVRRLIAAEWERAEAAWARLAELENAITWGTSCLSCSRVLDSAAAERERAERAEAKLAAIAEHCREGAEAARPFAAAGVRSAGVTMDFALRILAITGDEEKS